jgi:hypothetical protein
MPQYKITVEFKTDRPLTDDEIGLIGGAVQAQVNEPVDAEGEDMDVAVSDVQVKTAEDNKFARVAWTAEDILTLRPEWTEEKADEWLAQNERHIQDRSVELGWEVIETLLD